MTELCIACADTADCFAMTAWPDVVPAQAQNWCEHFLGKFYTSLLGVEGRYEQHGVKFTLSRDALCAALS